MVAREQDLLQHPGVTISSSQIPDDSFNGVSVASMITSTNMCNDDVTNTMMFRNGAVDNISFQYALLRFEQHRPMYHARHSNQANIMLPNKQYPSLLSNKIIDLQKTNTPPTIQSLFDKIYSTSDTIKDYFKLHTNKTWNLMFHEMLRDCHLEKCITSPMLPDCYSKNRSCGHTLHVEQDSNIKTTFQLTLLEHTETTNVSSISNKDAITFIQLVVKQNPIWDLGLQFLNVNRNEGKIYPKSISSNKEYTRKCICPCSEIFDRCRYSTILRKLALYQSCKSGIFDNPMDMVCHLQ